MPAVNLAIIGCGGRSRAHLDALIELRNRGLNVINLVAVCDVVGDRAKALAGIAEREMGRKPSIYTDMKEMLRQESSLDAVDVVTDHRSHHTVAVPCLEAGKHVIVEKPLGITMRAARLMIETAEKHGRILATAEDFRRRPADRAVKWAIEQGKIGMPRMLLSIHWLGHYNPAWFLRYKPKYHDKLISGGGWILDAGVHFADIFLYNLGEVEEVYAVTKTFEPIRYWNWHEKKEPTKITVEDTCTAILKFKNGAVGVWMGTDNTLIGEDFDERYIIYGTKGSITWRNEDWGGGHLEVIGPGGVGKQVVPMSELKYLMMNSLSDEEKERFFPAGITNSTAITLWDFADAIISKRKPEVDGVLGAKALAIPLAVYESSWLGQSVKVEKVENCEIENYQREINESLGLL